MDKKKDIRLFDACNRILVAGIAFAVCFWFVESYIHAYILFKDNAFGTHFFHPNPHELWMRAAIVLMVTGLSLYARRLIRVRKEADAALVESEERFREMAENADEVFWMMPVSLDEMLYISPAYESIWGRTCESLYNNPGTWLDAVFEEDKERVRSSFSGIAADGFHQEYRIQRPDGSLRWIRDEAFPVKNARGEVYRIAGFARDITESKRAEEELRRVSARLAATLEAVPDIVIEVDKYKVYTWTNRAGLEFFGDDVIGTEASDYFKGEQETHRLVGPLFKGSEDVVYVESWQRRKDGEKRLLAWWCRVIKDADGNVSGAISTARDVTEKKRAEEELKERLHETERMNRLMVGRELAMVRLKEKVKALEERLKGRGES